LSAKIGLIAALIVTAVVGVYGIELGIRVSTGSERPEILAVVLIVLVLLFFVNIILLAKHQKTKQGNFFEAYLK
jgi:phosphoglycerol transferase MdoB-like AlkP superfamily enzyme